MKTLLEKMLELQLELEVESTPFWALDKAIINTVLEFNSQNGLTARRAVLYFLESTCLIPGVFNVDMLRERQLLQEYLHGPQHIQSFRLQTLEYRLVLAPEKYRAPIIRQTSVKVSKGTQTEISNPTEGELLNFTNRQYSLGWFISA